MCLASHTEVQTDANKDERIVPTASGDSPIPQEFIYPWPIGTNGNQSPKTKKAASGPKTADAHHVRG